MQFTWSEQNVEHLAKHGVFPHQAEQIVQNAKPPYPQMIGEDKRIVIGRLSDGQYVQVIYVPSRSVRGAVYVIHARPLTEIEKRRFRKRKR